MNDIEVKVLYTLWFTYRGGKNVVVLERLIKPSKAGKFLDMYDGLMDSMWYMCPTEYYNNNLR
jgi:hypothetical protein